MPQSLLELIEHLKDEGVLKSPGIIAAYKAIDRKDFVLPEYRDLAYSDRALVIGYEQTISQPYTVAFMLELLGPAPGERILDVGSGSGRTTALLAHVVGKTGRVYGVELVPELVEMGRTNLAKYPHLSAEIHESSEVLGLSKEAPFDRILVSAESAEVPIELVKQLRVGGVMVVPISGALCRVTKVSETESTVEKFEGFSFVPLRT